MSSDKAELERGRASYAGGAWRDGRLPWGRGPGLLLLFGGLAVLVVLTVVGPDPTGQAALSAAGRAFDVVPHRAGRGTGTDLLG